jgi:hypothetical protein
MANDCKDATKVYYRMIGTLRERKPGKFLLFGRHSTVNQSLPAHGERNGGGFKFGSSQIKYNTWDPRLAAAMILSRSAPPAKFRGHRVLSLRKRLTAGWRSQTDRAARAEVAPGQVGVKALASA